MRLPLFSILVPGALLAAALACTRADPPITIAASAARVGDTVTIRKLAAAGYDLNAADPGHNHWTPLLHAIHKGRRDSVEALIAAGADVNRKAKGGVSPLEMAAGNGQADVVRRLLAAGADPREPGVFAVAVSGGALTDIEEPLLGRCNTDVVRTLIEREPSLRLPRNGPGRLSWLFARLNGCAEVLQMAAFRQE